MTRLDEITRPYRREAFEALRSHGYEMLGEGTFAYIWAKPGASTVLKIFSKGDDAYLDYANLVMKHQDNPHFPKLQGKLIRVNDDYFAVRMERLRPLPAKSLYIRAVAEYFVWHDRWAAFRAAYPKAEDAISLLFAQMPKLKDACDIIISNVPRTRFDIHQDNIMARNSLPVITDPVA